MIGFSEIWNLIRHSVESKNVQDLGKIENKSTEIHKELSDAELGKGSETKFEKEEFDPDKLVDSAEGNHLKTLGAETEFNPDELTKLANGIQGYYDDNGKLYRKGDDLIPDETYEVNGYRYSTDGQGRIISAEGKLRIKEHEGRKEIKDSIEIIGKGDERETDDRGHLIGDQFDGSNGMENMIPQDSKLNRGEYKNLEMNLRKEVESGRNVRLSVEPQYEGDSNRPSEITVTYSVDGNINVRIFRNEGE